MVSRNRRHFFFFASVLLRSSDWPFAITNGPGLANAQIPYLGRSRMSLLAVSLFRTAEMFFVSRTVAADTGMLFLKKDLSRTRIARLTGGRNMVVESPEEKDDGGLETALESIEWSLIRARKKNKK